MPPRELLCRDRRVLLGREPLIVGILNVTDDSFFDGGRFNALEAAVAHARQLVDDGAALLDLGGQSTRPGYTELAVTEEIRRVVPIIRELAGRIPVPLSIDTYKPDVARAAIEAGAHLVNDVHGLQGDPAMADVIAQSRCAAILMHNDPALRDLPAGADVLSPIKTFFDRTLALADRAGIDPARIILDPGIGFAKTQEQNLALLARLGELHELGHPLLLGASRKSVIGNVLGLPPEERLEGTLATTALAVWQGVDFLRVHDVRANRRVALMAAAIRNFQTT
ncbi:MAG: dihydropteroate synthase [Verrucomicrobia bacterium]|nr:dihydropteroate synthase [Verrucomicrobiota bacterium]